MRYLFIILLLGIIETSSAQTVLPPYGPAAATITPVRTELRIDTAITLPSDPPRGNLRITAVGMDIKKVGDTLWSPVGSGEPSIILKPGNGTRIENDTVKIGRSLDPFSDAGSLTETTNLMIGDPFGDYTGVFISKEDNTVLVSVNDAVNGNGTLQVSAAGASLTQNNSGVSVAGGELMLTGAGTGPINIDNNANSQPMVYFSDPTVNLSALAVPPKSYVDAEINAYKSSDAAIRATLTTTDATLTTIATIPIPNGGMWAIYFKTVNRNSATEGASFDQKLLAGNNGGGTAAILGGGMIDATTSIKTSGMTSTAVSATTSGGNILLQVTGIVGTVTWEQYITILKL